MRAVVNERRDFFLCDLPFRLRNFNPLRLQSSCCPQPDYDLALALDHSLAAKRRQAAHATHLTIGDLERVAKKIEANDSKSMIEAF